MKARVLCRLSLVVASATSRGMWGRRTAGKAVERRGYLIGGKIIVGRHAGPLEIVMVLLGHWGEALLSVEEHLLVRPLSQLGVCGIEKGRLLG